MDDEYPRVQCGHTGCARHAVAVRPLQTLSSPETVDPTVTESTSDPDQPVPLCLVHFREQTGT